MRNKQKSFNRRVKRGHVIVKPVITERIVDYKTDPILGGMEPVYKKDFKIIVSVRSKRGKIFRQM